MWQSVAKRIAEVRLVVVVVHIEIVFWAVECWWHLDPVYFGSHGRRTDGRTILVIGGRWLQDGNKRATTYGTFQKR